MSAPLLLVAALALPAAAKDRGARKRGEPSVPAPEVTGLLQVWGTAWDQDQDEQADPAGYGDPEDDVGFKIRRARIGVEAENDDLRYDIEVGFASSYDAVAPVSSTSIQLVSADAGYQVAKGVWISGGVQQVPVTRSFLMSTGQLATGDRALASQWSIPGRDVGVLLDGTTGSKADGGFKARLRAGVFNGNGSNAGSAASALLGDNNDGLLIAVRAEGVYGPGSAYRTWGEVDGFTIGFAGDFWTEDDLNTKTLGYGGDVLMRVAGLAVLGEAHLHTISPNNSDIIAPGVLADTPRLGLTGQVGYSVWMVEPVVRYSRFDDNRDLEDNGDVALIEGGVTWHGLDDGLRAGLLYVHRQEVSGLALANDTLRLWMQLQF